MKKNPPPLTKVSSFEILVIICVLGLVIRFTIVSASHFPVNDGGLFLTMAQDLLNNHLLLPYTTSYNQSQIPFTYPPLGFYVVAIVHALTRLSLLSIFKYLPLIISTLSIPLVFLISRKIFSSDSVSLFSTLSFTLIPKSYEWLIMGGGLTRSFGLVFVLSSIYLAFNYFSLPTKRNFLLTTISLSLTFLSHLEMSLFGLYSLFLISTFYYYPTKRLRHLLSLIISSLIVCSPWLVLVLSRHGISPFLSAFSTGFWSLGPLVALLTFNLSGESHLTLISVTGLMGFIYCLAQKKYFLAIWLTTICLISPRSYLTLASIPLSLLSGLGIFQVTNFFIINKINLARLKIIFLIIVMTSASISISYATYSQQSNLRGLTQLELESFEWIKNHTSSQSKFLIITPQIGEQWASDRIAEWFPTLTQRISLNTLQGYEWIPQKFQERYNFNWRLKKCSQFDLACLEYLTNKYQVSFDYVYYSKMDLSNHELGPCCSLFASSLNSSSHYQIVFDNSTTTIWQKTPRSSDPDF